MFQPSLSHVELFTLNLSIQDVNNQLSICQSQIDQLTGLIAAFDNNFNQSVFDMGKALPNVEARKLFLFQIEQNNADYQDLLTRMAKLKASKVDLLSLKEFARTQVSIGLSEHKSNQLRMELSLLEQKAEMNLLTN